MNCGVLASSASAAFSSSARRCAGAGLAPGLEGLGGGLDRHHRVGGRGGRRARGHAAVERVAALEGGAAFGGDLQAVDQHGQVGHGETPWQGFEGDRGAFGGGRRRRRWWCRHAGRAEIGLADHGRARQQLGRAAGHQRAALQHVAAVGHGQCLLDVLLDHQHGGAGVGDAPRHAPAARRPSSAPDPARARRASAGAARSSCARATATICCSPPLMVPASCWARSRSLGKSAKACFERCARARPWSPASRRAPGSRSPSSAETADGLRPPAPRRRCTISCVFSGRSSPSSMTMPWRRDQPGERLEQRRLAGAVGAEDHGQARAGPPASDRAAPGTAP